MIPLAAATILLRRRKAEEITLQPNEDSELKLKLSKPKVGPDGVMISKVRGGEVRVKPHRRGERR